MAEERLWCTACGTVTRDMICDCNCYGMGHEMNREPNFVNYADAMQEAAHEQAQQIDAMVKALERLLRFMDDATLYEMQHPADYSPYLDAKALLDAVEPKKQP